MTTENLIVDYGFKQLSNIGEIRQIKSIYACDLLSWVMAKGQEDMAWVTVQSHINVLAVASLLDFACVIIPESIIVEQSVIEKANQENILLLSSDKDVYEIFKIFYQKEENT